LQNTKLGAMADICFSGYLNESFQKQQHQFFVFAANNNITMMMIEKKNYLFEYVSDEHLLILTPRF
jgi:hypothetical protein